MRNKTIIPQKKHPRRSLVDSIELELWFLGLVVIGVNFGIFWKQQMTPTLISAFSLPNTSAYMLLTILGLTVFTCLLLISTVIVLLVKMKRVKDRLTRLENPDRTTFTDIHFYEAAETGDPDPDAEPEMEDAPA